MWKTSAIVGLCFLLSGSPLRAVDHDLAIVVHPDVPAADLSLGEVLRLLVGDRQFWSRDLRVTLLMPAPMARERGVVLKTIYRMDESQFRQYWIGKVFRAEAATGPKIVYSDETAVELLTNIRGSIGFLDAAQVPRGLKILKIDGKRPGEKGYPLH